MIRFLNLGALTVITYITKLNIILDQGVYSAANRQSERSISLKNKNYWPLNWDET